MLHYQLMCRKMGKNFTVMVAMRSPQTRQKPIISMRLEREVDMSSGQLSSRGNKTFTSEHKTMVASILKFLYQGWFSALNRVNEEPI